MLRNAKEENMLPKHQNPRFLMHVLNIHVPSTVAYLRVKAIGRRVKKVIDGIVELLKDRYETSSITKYKTQ